MKNLIFLFTICFFFFSAMLTVSFFIINPSVFCFGYFFLSASLFSFCGISIFSTLEYFKN